MLRPFLLVGVGGSGGKTLRAVRHALSLKLGQQGWSRIPAAWQFLHFDSPVKQDGNELDLPFLPQEQYKALVASNGSYESVHAAIRATSPSKDVADDILRMFPERDRVRVAVTKGAGQFRAIGRAIVVSRLDDVVDAAKLAIGRMQDASALGELQTLGARLGARNDGGSAEPTVIVVSSIAGGSGAGQFLDVIEAIKGAAPGAAWADQTFALLYAPDVFDGVAKTAHVAGNTLAALAETMNGYWTRTPSKATVTLYRNKGVPRTYGDPSDRVGATYPFIVGRKNSKVAFETQGDVYKAIGNSLAAWMTDDDVQSDMVSYSQGNWDAKAGASELFDATRLMPPLDETPPFSSIGFGRVTLGREKFEDYASERLARTVVDLALYQHFAGDERFEKRTETDWIAFRTTRATMSFIRLAELDEEHEGNDQVLEKLRPEAERGRFARELRQETESAASANVDHRTGALPADVWGDQITQAYTNLVDGYLSRDADEVSVKVKQWVEEGPQLLLDAVTKYTSTEGLSVAVGLLEELRGSLRKAVENLRKESEQRHDWSERLEELVRQELALAPNHDSLRSEQDAVVNALDRAIQCFEWEAEARTRQVTSDLLDEFQRDYVKPLQERLDAARAALRDAAEAPRLADGEENEFHLWPRRVDQSVPAKYHPAPNERLLVAHTDYPREFERLVAATPRGSGSAPGGRTYQDAVVDAVAEILHGAESTALNGASVEPFIRAERNWKPATTGRIGHKASDPSAPQFAVANRPEDFRERARDWMKLEGRAFTAYLGETLKDHFDPEKVADHVLRARTNQFREALLAALGASEPLVEIHPQLLATVHNKTLDRDNSRMVSAIPFTETGNPTMYEVTKKAFQDSGIWDEEKSPRWFRDAQVDGIEVFTMLGFPFQPVVMNSVMRPVTESWLKTSVRPDSRRDFWKWKRARPLREAVPAAGDVFDAMLRGWYVAKSLNQLKIDTADQSRGPRLSVFDPQKRTHVDFPHPLLYAAADVVPGKDFPGAILESLMIALPLSNAAGSLEPLRPYHVLIDLGGSGDVAPHVVEQWVRGGQMPDFAPIPNPERAGTAGGTMEERKEALRGFFEHEIAEFDSSINHPDPSLPVHRYPVSWEIRDAVDEALRALIAGVVEIESDNLGI